MPNSDIDARWDEQLAACVSVIVANSRWPKRATEPEVFNWLSGQKRALADGKLTRQRKAALDRKLPGWSARQRLSPGDAYEGTVQWIEKHGRTPRPNATAESPRYVSLQKMRKAAQAGALDAELVQRLDATSVEWRGRGKSAARPDMSSFDAHWYDRLEELRLFVERYERLPRVGDKSSTGERSLGHWLRNQRRAALGQRVSISISDERLEALNDAVPDWIGQL